MIMRQRRLRRAADQAELSVALRRAELGQHAADMSERWQARLRSPLAVPVAFGAGVVFGQLRGAVSLSVSAVRLTAALVRFERMATAFTLLAAYAADRVHLTVEHLAAVRGATPPSD